MKVCGFLAAMIMAAGIGGLVFAGESGDISELKLRDWHPRSMLKTRETSVEKPAYPVFDVHNHLGGGKSTLTAERVRGYLAEMDAAGVRTVVNLDGGSGQRLKETLTALDEAHPGRGAGARREDWRRVSRQAPRV